MQPSLENPYGLQRPPFPPPAPWRQPAPVAAVPPPAVVPAVDATAKFTAPPIAAPDARRDELVALLEKHKGNVSKVAADLGRVRQQVQRWLKRYGLDPERYRS